MKPSVTALRSFATRLRDWQRKEHLTQKEAAEKIGVKLRTYEAWLGAKGAPRDGNLGRLKDACGEWVIAPLLDEGPRTDALLELSEEQAMVLDLHDEWLLAQPATHDLEEAVDDAARELQSDSDGKPPQSSQSKPPIPSPQKPPPRH